MSGTLYGLGIGPGDPQLITVKARAILAAVPVIAYPAPAGGESLVRAIADPHIPAGRTEIVISTPMCGDRFPAEEVYDRYAAEIAGHLQAGRAVAVLCEGDPFLYGSFMYLYQRLAGEYLTEVVPGVSSLGAVAAAAGRPLASRNEVLTVLPAPLPEGELIARLAASDAAAIVKVGRHLAKIRRVLRRLGLAGEACYVERATMPSQRVLPLAEVGDDQVPYFSMILVHRRRSAAPSQALPRGTALVALTAGGLEAARRLQPALPGSEVHGLAGRCPGADVPFTDPAAHLGALFAAGTPIVALCAAGIVVRALAPLVADKHREPPVVAAAEDLSVAVPLLGGHHGANLLARAIADAAGAVAAITTASDVRHAATLDAPPPGWRIANPAAVKEVSAALLAGEEVALRVEAGDAGWLGASGAPFAATGALRVTVTDRALPPSPADLVLHPPVLAVGIGCERGTAAEEVVALVEETLRAGGLAAAAVACVASLELKADEPAVHAAAAALGVPARFFAAEELEAETPRLRNPSSAVFRAVGCHGVAEAAALAAAGREATLLVAKTRSPRATCAVARAAHDIDPLAIGRPQGSLSVVGIGPGDTEWRTPAAMRALAGASDVVGYGLYLDLLGGLIAGQRRHASAIGEERARVETALDLAGEGRRVALVGSGDAGVYGLASLVFERIAEEHRPAWRQVAIAVEPGLSAFLAAAARAGAPIGHDFCAISLSDLLTPWAQIRRRLEAAAAADFVVALYNPVSRRRRRQLAEARDILLTGRPATTPVVLARNLGRAGEEVEIIDLAGLSAERADMLTLILVGNSETRRIDHGGRRWVYTPRGYAGKAVGAEGQR